MNLSAVRAELPVLERYAYLNAGTNGPLPRRSGAAMMQAVERDLAEGRSSKPYFESLLAQREELRGALSRVLEAPAETIALATSTTEGCNIVLTGLGIGRGDEVVTTDSEHPGLFGGLLTSGADVREVELSSRPAGEALDALDAAITPKTRLIALSHVSWLTGTVFPARELTGRGIPVLVDGAQAAGAIPVDVEDLGCDFYTVSAQKWLLGPDVTGALYVHPDWTEKLRMTFPSYASWDWEAEERYVARATAARFDPGWISAASMQGLLESLAFAEALGAERFRRARDATERCRELLGERFELISEPEQGTLVTWKAEGDSAEAVARLAEAGVIVRDLPGRGWLRASCGFWTSDGDLERLTAAL
jgi:selenocysteine lyase/cysteine desulfurase